MPSVFSFFCFFFVAEASPSVRFVMASLGNVVMEKFKKQQKCVIISSEDARSKPTVIVLCSTWTLFECFISGERLLKRSIIPFVTVVPFC